MPWRCKFPIRLWTVNFFVDISGSSTISAFSGLLLHLRCIFVSFFFSSNQFVAVFFLNSAVLSNYRRCLCSSSSRAGTSLALTSWIIYCEFITCKFIYSSHRDIPSTFRQLGDPGGRWDKLTPEDKSSEVSPFPPSNSTPSDRTSKSMTAIIAVFSSSFFDNQFSQVVKRVRVRYALQRQRQLCFLHLLIL